MTSKAEGSFQVVDKRRSHVIEHPGRRSVPAGWRAHSVLMGYFNSDYARRFLKDKALQPELVEELMQQREFAQARMQSLPPLNMTESSAQTLTDDKSIAEINR